MPERFYGLFKKEFALQSGSSLGLVNRLILGPLVSLGTTGILYNSFFSLNPHSSLGELSGANYLTFVAFGFLLHAYLNAGYYCFSSKIVAEAASGTLQVLWIAPYNRLVSLFSLASMEGVRCFGILLLSMWIAGMPERPLVEAVSLQFLCFLVFLPICLTIGMIRAMLVTLSPDAADFLDHGYLVLVLTACPYIPNAQLPKFLQVFSQINPAYYMGQVMRGAWKETFFSAANLLPLAGLTALILLTAYAMWNRNRAQILERSFV